MRAVVRLGVVMAMVGCGDDGAEAQLFAIGDSFLEFHEAEDASIPVAAAERLGMSVHNAAVSGALLTGDEPITDQYTEGVHDWLVMGGGGNDVHERCGCDGCDDLLDQMISEDGSSGMIPDFVSSVTGSGVRVAFVGYLDMPDTAADGFDGCNEELEVIRTRLGAMADGVDVLFVDASDVVSVNDLHGYEDDHVHPSQAGAASVGRYLAERIAEAG